MRTYKVRLGVSGRSVGSRTGRKTSSSWSKRVRWTWKVWRVAPRGRFFFRQAADCILTLKSFTSISQQDTHTLLARGVVERLYLKKRRIAGRIAHTCKPFTFIFRPPRACACTCARVRLRVRVCAYIRAWVCALHSRVRTRAPGSCYLPASPGECANQLSGTRLLTPCTDPAYLVVTGGTGWEPRRQGTWTTEEEPPGRTSPATAADGRENIPEV